VCVMWSSVIYILYYW